MNTLAGSSALVRLIVRRDRRLLALWILLLAAYPVLGGVPFTESSEPTAAAREAYVDQIAGNPGFLMLYGPAYGSSIGALTVWRTGDLVWIVALVSLLTVIRHTRSEEEAGRRELLGATVVGRHAALAAAVTATLAANLVLAVLVAVGMITQGLPAGGSIALGLKLAVVGWMFAAVAAVAAQLTQSAGPARGIAVAVLGATFLLRAVGDAGGSGASWLAWLSPLGWAHRIRPYAGERWWILAPALGVVVVLAAVAVALSARRDVGAGLLPPRLGPATASGRLRSPLALAWRLHRGSLLGWSTGLAVIGGVFASSAAEAGSLFRDNPGVHDVFESLGGQAAPGDLFLAAIMAVIGMLAAAYAVSATLRLRSEEVALRAEPVLATSIGRWRWAASHLTYALLGPAVALAAAGVSAGLVYGFSVGDVGRELPRVVAGAMVQLPAVWVLTAISLALFGVLPRLASGGWAAWGVVVFLGQVGAMLRLRQGLLDISPFTHIPKLPGGGMNAAALAWLLAITAVLVIIGLVGFRTRDIART